MARAKGHTLGPVHLRYRPKPAVDIPTFARALDLIGIFAFALSGGQQRLAAIAGVVVAPLFVVDPLMWLDPLITVLAIVVLGGLGSLKGSVIGALIIGYVETSTVFLLPAGSFLKSAVALSIMVLVLVVRPEGLFGIAFEEER